MKEFSKCIYGSSISYNIVNFQKYKCSALSKNGQNTLLHFQKHMREHYVLHDIIMIEARRRTLSEKLSTKPPRVLLSKGKYEAVENSKTEDGYFTLFTFFLST